MTYTVGELAKLAGVSVRTLHHYDEVGLLPPCDRSAAGYRLYGREEVERLHRIAVYRELGFDLAGIARILDDSAEGLVAGLEQQRTLLVREIARLTRMKKGVEKMMESRRKGMNLTKTEMKEIFGDFDPREHHVEAAERWEGTDAYEESQSRVARHGKEQWREMGREAERITAGLAQARADGVAASGDRAMDLAEEHRRHISRWFYDCTYEIHRGLGEMYVADPRFAKHYDDREPGLSAFLREAIQANADRMEAK